MTDVYKELKKPFPLDAHWWKPGATSNDRCLALTYVVPRAYIDRLNDLGIAWEDDYETIVLSDRIFIVCRLTVEGQTRTDVGEEYLTTGRAGENVYTTAIAQAFKRACVKFGMGGYLYSLPQEWVDYDRDRKRITPKGLTHLQGMLAYHLGDSDKKPEPTTAEPASKQEPTPAEKARKRATEAETKPDGKWVRPAPPEKLRDMLRKRIAEGKPDKASAGQAKYVAQIFKEVWAGEIDGEERYHTCLEYLTGESSASDLTKVGASALIKNLREEPDSKENYNLHPAAIEEMNAVWDVAKT